jgi:DNA protecting protein DprA
MTDTLPVFRTFQDFKIPEMITVQSINGDVSMLSELPEQGFAIVGTRYPQRRSLELLEESISVLKQSDLIIISGFARGIDARAHELAIEYGLRTIAVFGCGIELTYPRENQSLRQAIVQSGGLVVSQFADQAEPYASHFHRRNELIAGFSKATWVVEAAEVSGTLNTANAAMKLNRDVYATSCFPNDQFYQGNLKLLSKRETLRYPMAEAFYSAESLCKTWFDIAGPHAQKTMNLNSAQKTKIQRWVIELQSAAGLCHVQALMNYASSQGHTLGNFYQEFETEVALGLLTYDSEGIVQVKTSRD